MELLLALVLAVVTIALATALAPRVGILAPLVLVVVGVMVSLLPFVPDVLIDPEWILMGILPPLLYSAAVSLPAMEFRRDFAAISSLSVALVIVTAFALGVFFAWVIPGLGIALAIALGAILSPTDAVATSIVRRLGISPRTVTVLEGESLLNDATALVLLSSATGAATGAFGLAESVLDFVWAVVAAVGIGLIVGLVNLRVRAWVANTAAATALSFVVPFVAYLPTEHLGGSGLVAAVVAGIVTGQGAPRWFTPAQRISDHVNWRTIELILEGAVFLLMGLELATVLSDSARDHGGLGHAAWLAAAAVAIVLVLRTGWVAPLVWLQSRRTRAHPAGRNRLRALEKRIDAAESRMPGASDTAAAAGGADGNPAADRPTPRPWHRARRRVRRALADIDYFESSPLGWRHGTIIVWAGMRGAVTLAAAQTLPRDTPSRSLIVLVAFLVAAGTLLLQGGTLAWLTRALRLGEERTGTSRTELEALNVELHAAAAAAVADPALTRADGRAFDDATRRRVAERWSRPRDGDLTARAHETLELRLVAIRAMRARLVAVRGEGAYATATLRRALGELDAEELSLQQRLGGS
ncbi:sodium:proton antiporter [Microbacterium sp. LRZ72]|uniref:cation:proton antiporter n=1 Tax=Microbacterium sp. LRZ72 TaxID=2942481 RepID=UPI0029A56CB5|nr:sodium:proton antiporter [Microbacterium sp. LRZ72]MDX2377473.1 sodium:proton antiporter [Microbacterium sp. LRZ72]